MEPNQNQSMKKNHGNSAVARVRKYFPSVNKVVDAKDTIEVSVTKKDSNTAKPKNPSQCALAQACVRELKADGAIINVGYSYVINGEVATRYATSVAVGREITSFDRGGEFEAGFDYKLSKVSPSNSLGSKRRVRHTGTRPPHRTATKPQAVHHTVNIRTK
jgi:hypothetical protein